MLFGIVNNPALAAVQFFAVVTIAVSADVVNYWPQCRQNLEYSLPDSAYCDKYFVCKDGVLTERFCPDGLGFVPYAGCKPLHQVECGPRNQLQTPLGTGKCQRLNGVFSAPEGCGRFYKCYQGFAQPDACPKGQMFDDVRVQCRYPTSAELSVCTPIWYPETATTQAPAVSVVPVVPVAPVAPVIPAVPSSEMQTVTFLPAGYNLEGLEIIVPDPNLYKCPANDAYPFGAHSRHPIAGNCKFFLLCQSDGVKKIAGCPDGLGFNPKSSLCEDSRNIPGCVYYYSSPKQ
ncbi:uncharacterized protein [Neodiprion pinetum]|uniref:uncharacterized protein n=1 Tax=Neodiprion pinetum TaxID=441929 RepID=UPI001EDE3E96|nr:uncharacterized protein LOC124212291 [Neodiprion pinetum]